jgi:putative peptide zinc metalloprotease protein
VRLPERPALAPGIRLAGQMHESAFQDPPWLLERQGAGYVQVTELLYRIAELCDGTRDFDELARAVSKKTGRGVSADNVKQLVRAQLVMKGLVQTGDGQVVQTPSARSLLAINMRQRMIGSEALEPAARALELLFWPPILLTVLAAALLTQAWLYFVHGVARGAHDVLYAPGLLFVALLVTVVSAGFHELGHAAALRYGGGRAKGMGFGVYLIYPAFYTDVSDNYRLGRWGRVRTDLGGVYFNLVFILGVMGIYLLTRHEFLLMIIVLLNLEIVRQLQPLVRLDGYWIIADLTGVPDFLSRVGPFIKRLLPITSEEAEKMPPLKWWGALVFGAYVFIAIPLLVFLIGTMLLSVPRILATGLDSARNQVMAFSQAQAAGDWLGMLASIAQVLLIALPMLGVLYSAYRIGSRAVAGVWKWGQASAQRRVIAAAGAVALAATLFHFWGPGFSFLHRDPTAPSVSRWTPIQPTDRGTAFDVVGVAPPAWIPDTRQPGGSGDESNSPAAAPSPTPDGLETPTPALSPIPAVSPTPSASSAPSGAPVEKTIPTPARGFNTAPPNPAATTTPEPSEEPAAQPTANVTPTRAAPPAAPTSTASARLGASSTLPPVAPGAAAPTNTPRIPTPMRP